MTLIRHVPSAPLNCFINHLLYVNNPAHYPREKILPAPTLDLKINLGGAFRAYTADQAAPFAHCADSWWVGLWHTYHIIDWPLDVRFFMIEFKPGGAYPFLQMPLSELRQDVIALDAVWGSFAAQMRDQLEAAPTLTAAFALLENMLLARLGDVPHGLNAVQYAIAEIARQQGALSISALSECIGISQKHLIAQFKRLVGTTPKTVARMYRFQHALHRVDPAQPVNWTTIAHHCLYHDQSHFDKDFAAFTGHSPSDYLRLRRRIQVENPQHRNYLRQLPTG